MQQKIGYIFEKIKEENLKGFTCCYFYDIFPEAIVNELRSKGCSVDLITSEDRSENITCVSWGPKEEG